MIGRETPLVFVCAGSELVGLLHEGHPRAPLGVVIVVGGPQYRVGSHRQFVELGRSLAASGIPVLRFDYRGMGDSGGGFGSLDQIGDDIQAAVDALLAAHPGIERVVLWGLCDGASAILLHAHRIPALAGVVLLNPWVRTAETFARTQLRHYYLARLVDREFWRRLVGGKITVRTAFADMLRAVRVALRRCGGSGASDRTPAIPSARPLPDRMARGLAAYDGPVLLILSGNDLTAREFETAVDGSALWRDLLAAPRIARRDLPDADHTFSRATWKDTVARWTRDWITEL